MEKNSRKNYIRAISFLSVLSLVLGVSTIVYGIKNRELKLKESIVNEKVISSLCESLDSISVALQKSLYTADKDALLRSGNELCRQAATAKESLTALSPEGELSEEIYKFLSQVGQFTLFLAQKGDKNAFESLGKLYAYASALSSGINEICVDYYDEGVSFGEAISTLKLDEAQLPDNFYSRMNDTAQTLGDYPTLVYDGPFADSLLNKGSVFLKDEDEITKKEARKKVSELIGISENELRLDSDSNGSVALYNFSFGNISLGITKKGGYLCYILSDAYSLEETISPEEAIRRGEKQLEKLGYGFMQSTYYTIYDGICTINYAYKNEDIIYYGDLIKVSIALDTGKLISLDAKTYLMNHCEREIPERAFSFESALKKVSPLLAVKSSGLAVIPLETGKEAFCYELTCQSEQGQNVLLYIDCLTGEQQNLLLLVQSDGGVLTK